MNSILGNWAEKFRPHPDGTQLPPHHGHCLGCGPDNPHGHHLVVQRRGEEVHAVHRFSERHMGAPGIAHGGAVATVLDDLFGFLLYLTGTPAVTRQLEVRYDAPVILGTSYELAARVVRDDGRKLFVEAEMSEVGGTTVATASALFLKVDIAHFDRGAPPAPVDLD
ncbi:PaaI family thioesterase [Nocardioides aquiterrae]|uniref:Acyl-coenzyme A thioesterase THEM4 n=1 Tax=Nocardioides aquiterrae TaxID=203799 RepID=A0ABN1UGD4_9ACTN